jgi:hypothetical protein
MMLAVVLAAGAMASAKAATIVDFGVLNIGDGETIGRTPPLVSPGAFTDDYLFQVSSSAAGAAALIEIEVQNFLDISNLILQIRTAAGVVLGTATGGSALTVAASSLAVGTQYLVRVSGNAVGALGGSYSGPLAIVPIPAALPLMLGALAGLGLIARRKTDAA